MAREMERLSALQVKRAKPGKHHDGGGLWLHVTKDGRYWFFRWGAGGANYLSLGPTHTISLEGARGRARACRELILDGHDPRVQRAKLAAARKLEAAKRITFAQAADRYFESHKAAWRSAKHGREWRSTLRTYAEPIIGGLSVADIDTDLVLRVLEPLWRAKPITGMRLRQRIESVLDFAKVHKLRDGDNPARWRGHLDHLLPRPRTLRPVKHFAALPYADMPDFMSRLRAVEGVPARCLEFLILTATRSGEARGAQRGEIDGDVWTVPGARMKRGKPHRVPLSAAAVAALPKPDGGAFVFPGRGALGLGDTALGEQLAALQAGCTVHGFRSAFRDWAGDCTSFPREVVERALAHRAGNATEESYWRSDMLEARSRLMEEWAAYCGGRASARVVPLRGRRHG